MKEVKLPTGAVLKVTPAPFADAKALYQAVLDEVKPLSIAGKPEVEMYKDLFCAGFSSKKIEAALWECFKRCQYCDQRGDLKIDKDTFEPVESRDDYLTVCMEVAKENLAPFVKSLYAEYAHLFRAMKQDPT